MWIYVHLKKKFTQKAQKFSIFEPTLNELKKKKEKLWDIGKEILPKEEAF